MPSSVQNRLKTYSRLDLSIGYQLTPKTEQRWKGKIGLSFINLLNRRNILSRQFIIEIEEDDPEFIPLERNYLRFTPNLMVRIEWGK